MSSNRQAVAQTAYSALDGSSWVNPNGNRNVPYLNRNGSKRDLNLDWSDNDWNENCRFLAVRNSFHFDSPEHIGRVCLSTVFHPPADHPSYFRKCFAHIRKYVCAYRFDFPQQFEKELERIKSVVQ